MRAIMANGDLIEQRLRNDNYGDQTDKEKTYRVGDWDNCWQLDTGSIRSR